MDKNIAEKLLMHRKASGLSQEELAEKIGVSRQAVSKWERSETSPDTENLIALAKLYNISLDELVFGDKTKDNYEKVDETSEENDPKYSSSCKNNTNKGGDKVKISLSGIHVESDDGDKIDIGWKGIHVDSKDANVHIDKDGVNVAENGHILYTKPTINTATYRFFKKFPYPILTVIAYILFGYFNICGGWEFGWLIFLTIPLYYSLITAVVRKNASEFAYPILAVMIYLYVGMINSLWHPGWIIFLTVPVYYFLAEFLKKLYKKL